jgi:hypothetical protein
LLLALDVVLVPKTGVAITEEVCATRLVATIQQARRVISFT